ncbi:dihydropteroate synthase [Leucobacter triazinivorans]|uniref:7,8-dihydroneopterin aldolase n=1 Tax=Leucobacter triazinivorans TaxID=1784719 RepID=A0A4P6KIN3_9MICO|nr:dihydropteroate synthase [Leucobacter triazinivorans]QBE50210.1 dihydropteroate synthase [Leucobacter triazinivorans]
MGVLNVTPDSFSDGGRFDTAERAIARGIELVAQGADVVDVGGESTRPGAQPVSEREEQRRVICVVEELAGRGIAVSIDTIHAGTAAAAVAAGARYINDVSGGAHDPEMLRVAADASRARGVRFIAGHWRGVPDPAQRRSDYDDVVVEVRDALETRAAAARAAGVDLAHILLDPGLGFDKTGDQSWSLLARLDELLALGYPVLIGASRKRMIADALVDLPVPARAVGSTAGGHERDLATSVTSALAARAGAWGVRVHDVPGTVQALAVARRFQRGTHRLSATPAPSSSAMPAPSSCAMPAPSSSAMPAPSSCAMPAPSSCAMPAPSSCATKESQDPCPADAATPTAHGGLPCDRITLTGVEIFAHHGVFDFERERGQRFVIDVAVEVDLRGAAAGDELARTVHYGELAAAVVAAVERDPVDLIETVAERVAAVALEFDGVRSAEVTVHKPDAPIEAAFSDVSVTVVRHARTAGSCAVGDPPSASASRPSSSSCAEGGASPPSSSSCAEGGASPPSLSSCAEGGASPPSLSSCAEGGASPPSLSSCAEGGASLPSLSSCAEGGARSRRIHPDETPSPGDIDDTEEAR